MFNLLQTLTMEFGVIQKKKTRLGFLFIPFAFALLLLAYLPTWEEVVVEQPDGSITLSREREGTLEKRIDRLQNAYLYALEARTAGYFICPSCPEIAKIKGKFFLKKGEVFKFGVTINPQNRYTEKELSKFRLNFVVLNQGGIEQMMIEESIRIGSYAVLPENLARKTEYRLAIPPGCGTDLR